MTATCENCERPKKQCICKEVDKFFEENRELIDDLAEQEEADKEVDEKESVEEL